MKTIDHRTEKRYPFHWKVAIVFDGAEAKARMIYAVLSSGHRQFRCGIQFLNFKGSRRAMLKKSITARVGVGA